MAETKKKVAIPDEPRRIYTSTIERVNAHLDKNAKRHYRPKKNKTIVEKESFNDFLVRCIDAFELFKDAEVLYATDLYESLPEARGHAITKAVKTKTSPKMPTKVVIVGHDKVGT